MKTLLEVLKRHHKDAPQEIFCRFVTGNNVEDISYGKLVQESAKYSLHYRKNGVTSGDPVLIILKHSPHLFYSFIGAVMTGAIPSIMPFPSEKQDISHYRDSIRKLSERIRAKSIVTYMENLPEIESISKWLGIDAIIPEQIQEDAEIEWLDAEEDAVAFLQHSSGTTGLKKGVALSHKAVLNQVDDYSISIHLKKEDVIASWLPLYHDMGLIACFILPLVKQVKLVMMDPFEWVANPGMLFEQIEKNEATLCWLPNFAFNFLAATVGNSPKKYDLSSMRAFINCSEPCKQHSFEVFYEKFKGCGVKKQSLQTCYAMAENVFGITQSEMGEIVNVDYVDKQSFINGHYAKKAPPDDGQLKFLSVGKVILNAEIGIVDSHRKDLPHRHVGEIKIKSNSLFSGYFKMPDESSKVIGEGWFYTGDLGYLSDNELYITGRSKDLIIVHGKNYYAHDIEHIANKSDGIKKGRCVAVGVYNEAAGSEEAVLIAETDFTEPDKKAQIEREIRKMISRDLDLLVKDIYLVPLRWIVKTTSGKISRSENKKKYLKEKYNIEVDN